MMDNSGIYHVIRLARHRGGVYGTKATWNITVMGFYNCGNKAMP